MEERYLLFIAGAVCIVLNKLCAKGTIWWQREVMKFEGHFNIWFYRMPYILVGFSFILISIVKK